MRDSKGLFRLKFHAIGSLNIDPFMRTKCVISLLLAAWLIPSLTTSAADTPTVDTVLTKFISATGGKAAIEKIKTRVVKGKMDAPALSVSGADWTLTAKAPNKQATVVDVGGAGSYREGFDGAVGWASNPGEGIRVKSGEELAKAKRDADFNRELNFKTLYPDLAYKGTAKVDDEDVNILESKPSSTSKERFSFSVKSGLLVRQESEFESPQGAIRVTMHFKDYRPVDGVRYPHGLKSKIEMGGQEFEFGLTVSEVQHNVPVEDAKFTKPAS